MNGLEFETPIGPTPQTPKTPQTPQTPSQLNIFIQKIKIKASGDFNASVMLDNGHCSNHTFSNTTVAEVANTKGIFVQGVLNLVIVSHRSNIHLFLAFKIILNQWNVSSHP